MGTIVQFALRERSGQKPATRTQCQVTIFPGVRYERRAAEPQPPDRDAARPEPRRPGEGAR
jgi:hypothetical protein